MVTAGLTLIFGMMGVLNFAHAWFYMLGAYVGYTCTSRLGFWWGLIAAPVITGFCGILVERYMLRRVHSCSCARIAADVRAGLHHRGGHQFFMATFRLTTRCRPT